MEIHLHVGRRHLVVLAVIAAAVLGGVAYAAIPDAGGVLTACQLNSNGSLRLIDTSLSSGPLSRCTPNETQVQWNQQGQPGAAGQPGSPGKDGKDGASPTVAQLAAGDPHCPTGGASLTDGAGHVAYVCNGAAGQPGRDGAAFSGAFTSPNGQFALTVADAGVSIIGPDSSIKLPAAGGIAIRGGDLLLHGHDVATEATNDETVFVGHDRQTNVGHDESIQIGGDGTEAVGRDETIDIGGSRTEHLGKDALTSIGRSRATAIGANDSMTVAANRAEQVGGSLLLQSGGAMTVGGSLLSLNGAGDCKPAARFGDPVSSSQIVSGSASVCIGG